MLMMISGIVVFIPITRASDANGPSDKISDTNNLMFPMSCPPTCPQTEKDLGTHLKIIYQDCAIDSTANGLVIGPVKWYNRFEMDLAFQGQSIQFKFDGTWYTKNLDYDATGHPDCAVYDYTSGGTWYHGDRFHWYMYDTNYHADVYYYAWISVANDGSSSNIKYMQNFSYSAFSTYVTDFKAWWKFVPYVNGDSENLVYNEALPNGQYQITTASKNTPSTWRKMEFWDRL